MLSGVLRSKTAVAVNIRIMRAFVELQRAATSYTAIERRLEDLERETKETRPTLVRAPRPRRGAGRPAPTAARYTTTCADATQKHTPVHRVHGVVVCAVW
jgi:hypothetical protein